MRVVLMWGLEVVGWMGEDEDGFCLAGTEYIMEQVLAE